MPVKGIAIVLVAVLTVPNTSVALDQPITARILTATFMALHANDIILTPNRAKQKKTCMRYQAQYTVIKGQRHRYGYAKCPVCHEWVSIQDHKSHIQPVVEDEASTDPEGEGRMVAPPPLFANADFEAMQNAEGIFVANLLCHSSAKEEAIHVLKGEDCALQSLHDLDDLVDVANSDEERQIIVVFHNLKGFDGMLILHELYQQQREVVDHLTMGAKVLSFKSGPLKFIDSLCFLPIPLASFPSTCSLTELKKGSFPHLFNTPDNQHVRGSDLRFGILRSGRDDDLKERRTAQLA